jgi:aminoglycoside 2'-N-acetyltransferase I
MELSIVRSGDLPEEELGTLRSFLTEAFDGRFDHGNWANALGGTHVIARDRGMIAAHASVVPRMLYFSAEVDSWPDAIVREVGYVESVAVESRLRGRGLGSEVLNTINQLVRNQFGFGALATSSHPFYERAGWRRWAGPTYVYRRGEVIRTLGGEQWLMVLAPADTTLTAAIACEWRDGDLW